MGFIVNQFLKYGISLLDREYYLGSDRICVYKKWGISAAERLVQMLEDETKRAREALERLKKAKKKG